MNTRTDDAWSDAAAQRLLDSAGVSDFPYYSAETERAIRESVGRWPLLRDVFRQLDEDARPRVVATPAVLSVTAEVAPSNDPGRIGTVMPTSYRR
jgi:hypothetical protein